MPQAILRFAPSPNGRLHLGHAYSALLNRELAGRLGGRLLVRMEDIDSTRCTAEFAAHCLDDLSWLGLEWETPVRVQSRHMGDYRHALEALKNLGLLYPCFCSRSEIAAASHARDPDGAPLYPGTCRHLGRQDYESRRHEPHSWRLDVQKALAAAPAPYAYRRFDPQTLAQEEVVADPSRWGDVILSRKDIGTSYHLSVVTDDALQGVTHIVRGADLEAATDLHVLLQRVLGLPTPRYHHHRLLEDGSGDKLSKSKQSKALADLRAEGALPQEVRRILGFG